MSDRPTAPRLAALDGVVVTSAGVEAFDCPVCGLPRDLVVPACDDDTTPAGDECPDRACAVCGFALVVGSARPAPAVDTRRAG